MKTLEAYLWSCVILWGCLAIGYVIAKRAYGYGYSDGLQAKIPDDSLPCGHKRNPHQWGAWSVYGDFVDTNTQGVKGVVMVRWCSKPGCNLRQSYIDSPTYTIGYPK